MNNGMISYTTAKRLDLMRRAAGGCEWSAREIQRRDRIAELKRQALAEPSTCPEPRNTARKIMR